ncbi:MAG: peroxiredoxin [Paracoccaceae bacterium]
MTLTIGTKLPDAALILMTENGPEQVSLSEKLKDRKVIIFALPGAFTPTCSVAHVPSFIRTADKLTENGVDEIICISVNDAYVMGEWGKSTGGTAAGITFLADADSSFTTAIGMKFDAAATGLFGRSKRYSMLVENTIITTLNIETARGVCDLTGGETMLAQITG